MCVLACVWSYHRPIYRIAGIFRGGKLFVDAAIIASSR